MSDRSRQSLPLTVDEVNATLLRTRKPNVVDRVILPRWEGRAALEQDSREEGHRHLHFQFESGLQPSKHSTTVLQLPHGPAFQLPSHGGPLSYVANLKEAAWRRPSHAAPADARSSSLPAPDRTQMLQDSKSDASSHRKRLRDTEGGQLPVLSDFSSLFAVSELTAVSERSTIGPERRLSTPPLQRATATAVAYGRRESILSSQPESNSHAMATVRSTAPMQQTICPTTTAPSPITPWAASLFTTTPNGASAVVPIDVPPFDASCCNHVEMFKGMRDALEASCSSITIGRLVADPSVRTAAVLFLRQQSYTVFLRQDVTPPQQAGGAAPVAQVRVVGRITAGAMSSQHTPAVVTLSESGGGNGHDTKTGGSLYALLFHSAVGDVYQVTHALSALSSQTIHLSADVVAHPIFRSVWGYSDASQRRSGWPVATLSLSHVDDSSTVPCTLVPFAVRSNSSAPIRIASLAALAASLHRVGQGGDAGSGLCVAVLLLFLVRTVTRLMQAHILHARLGVAAHWVVILLPPSATTSGSDGGGGGGGGLRAALSVFPLNWSHLVDLRMVDAFMESAADQGADCLVGRVHEEVAGWQSLELRHRGAGELGEQVQLGDGEEWLCSGYDAATAFGPLIRQLGWDSLAAPIEGGDPDIAAAIQLLLQFSDGAAIANRHSSLFTAKWREVANGVTRHLCRALDAHPCSIVTQSLQRAMDPIS